jgi:3-hydroxyisobutyrate dehydrogenase-like beta-hydroxyacid dehydrogenase
MRPGETDGLRVGFVGLGRMGGAMAGHLLEEGASVTGWNRTASRASGLVAKGLHLVGTPREAVLDLVVVSVFDGDALIDVVEGPDGIAAGSLEGTVVIDTTTLLPEPSLVAARSIEAAGGTLLRAPVSGNTVLAARGDLSFLCSGDRAAYEHCAPLFEVLGRAHAWIGNDEEARVAKLALNLMIAGSMQLIAEALSFAESGGVERSAMLDVMKASAVGSPFVDYKADPLLADDYSPTFTVSAMRRDLHLLFELAQNSDQPLPVSGLVDQLLAACEGLGWKGADFAALYPLIRKLGGVDVAVRGGE